MGKWIAFGVLAKVEMNQKSDASIGLFTDLEWQHHMRHEAVENNEFPGFIGDPVPIFFGSCLCAIALEKAIHLVCQMPLMPNIQIAAGIMNVLGRSFNRNNAGVSPGILIENTIRVLQQTFRINMYVVDIETLELNFKTRHQKILSISGKNRQAARTQTRFIEYVISQVCDYLFDFRKVFQEKLIMLTGKPVITLV